jgi:NTP pyrophosphatase (non-canonical NTP hydrolase)
MMLFNGELIERRGGNAMKEVIRQLNEFRDARQWRPFHTPENLAKSIVLEAAELLENYQWGPDDADIENVKEEIADIITYCIFLCEHYHFDFKSIILEKMVKTGKKYPVKESKGTSKKMDCSE